MVSAGVCTMKGRLPKGTLTLSVISDWVTAGVDEDSSTSITVDSDAEEEACGALGGGAAPNM